MRITVNLSIFFHDHRSLVKIFIKKNWKNIKYVENHIAELFHIENFYLKCNNEYLPPSEDVQILNNDDIVWAIPVGPTAEYEQLENVEENDAIPPVVETKKRKKKRSSEVEKNKGNGFCESEKQDNLPDSTEHVVENDLIIIKKKKRKQKQNESFITSEGVNDENMKKKLKKQTEFPEMTHSTPKESGISSISCSTSENTPQKNQVKSLVDTFEKKKSSLMNALIVNDNKKRINIVKTIMISNKNKDDKLNEPNVSKEQSSVTTNTAVKENENNETESEGADNEDTSSTIHYTVPNGVNVNISRRKRKRTRKRKTSIKNKEFSTTLEQPVYNFIHKPVIVQAPTHVRFSENKLNPKEENPVECVENKINDSQAKKNEEIIELDDTQENLQPKDIKDQEESFSNMDIESCIAKHPIIQNTEPRFGDVIAFKILRLCEDYSPEMSAVIVGKVVDYQPETKEITFEITYGKDQCKFPQGKFSLEEEAEEADESSSKWQCVWSSLFEPRLLFP